MTLQDNRFNAYLVVFRTTYVAKISIRAHLVLVMHIYYYYFTNNDEEKE